LVSDSINLDLQESAIVLAKLLLPQIFEKMAMHDLRALVAERSIMNLYVRGETIEIPYHSIGFLLEGFMKTQGAEELILSPATLLPSHGSLSFQSLESSGMRRDYLQPSCKFLSPCISLKYGLGKDKTYNTCWSTQNIFNKHE
jgi:hypothetical protein